MRWPGAGRRAQVAVAVVFSLASLLGACSPGTDSSRPLRSTTTVEPAPPITVLWRQPFLTPLPNGWRIRDCEGDRVHVCVYDGNDLLGDIELLAGYPLSPSDTVADPQRVAVGWAEAMVATFRQERAEGCASFGFRVLEPRPITVGGRAGARGGFELTDSGGQVVERVVNHYVVVDGTMTIINTDAYARTGGCLPPSELDPSFTPDAAAELDAGLLDRIVAESSAEV